MQRAVFEDVRIEGHLIDSGIMSAGHGRHHRDGRRVRVALVRGRSHQRRRVGRRAARERRQPGAARCDPRRDPVARRGCLSIPPMPILHAGGDDGVFPDGFYSTTNMETDVRIVGRLGARRQSRDGPRRTRRPRRAASPRPFPWPTCARATCSSSATTGIRVHPHERPRDKQAFEFMSSAVSSEKPKAQVVAEVARMLRDTRAEGRDVIAVVGPAVVHTGAAQHLARLVEMGYISVLFGGNAVATHDIESALYGTSLGVGLEDGVPCARRARAPPARDQHHPRLRIDRRGRRAGRAHQGPHVHARQERRAVRARGLDPRRRPAARRHHRRASRRRTRCAPTPRTRAPA